MTNLSTISNDEARPEMDEMLHDYFQAEMPHPWPTFAAPRPMRTKQASSSWSRYSGRLALAACVGLLIAGYLTLGGSFPSVQTPSGVEKAANDAGQLEKLKTGTQTPKSKHINSQQAPFRELPPE